MIFGWDSIYGKSDKSNKRYEVTCIKKSQGRITHIGGQGWRLKEEDAIKGERKFGWKFYVTTEDGTEVDVIIAKREADNIEYLKTTADDTEVNNLLSLQEMHYPEYPDDNVLAELSKI